MRTSFDGSSQARANVRRTDLSVLLLHGVEITAQRASAFLLLWLSSVSRLGANQQVLVSRSLCSDCSAIHPDHRWCLLSLVRVHLELMAKANAEGHEPNSHALRLRVRKLVGIPRQPQQCRVDG